MSTTETILLVAVIILGAIVVMLALDRYRSRRLRSQFGPEYERTLREHGDPTKAEKDLAQRRRRVAKLDIRPLSTPDHDRFVAAWRADQAKFVDDPAGAVSKADRLVQELMVARGYPVADFDQRVEIFLSIILFWCGITLPLARSPCGGAAASPAPKTCAKLWCTIAVYSMSF